MRVLVADDHPLFRDGIASLLEAAGFEVIGQVGDGQAAIDAAQRLQPDLVLLDITMPETSGLEALRQIRTLLPDIKVVMLTVSEDDSDLFEAIRSGANGYLLKNLNANEFLNLLEGLDHGEAVMTRETTARLMRGFADLAYQKEASPDRLSTRELELLQLVAKGLSNKAIGQQLSVSVNTVKYHMKNILQKLGAQNRTEAVMMAIRSGLLKPDSSP
jgi:DNA-binding NarL/FixJ family response regulator